MPGAAAAFVLGVIGLHQLAELPDPFFLQWLPLVVVSGAAHRRARPLAWLCAGFLWATLGGHLYLRALLPGSLDGAVLHIDGVVTETGASDRLRARFEFEVRSARDATGVPPRWRLPARVRLSWYGERPALRVGDGLALVARLRRPRGMLNPGVFDYERWLYVRGVVAVGYVRASRAPPRRTGFRLRGLLAGRIDAALGPRPAAAIIRALAVGDRSGLSARQWATLRATGTGHLMAISGLHVGLVAGLALLVIRRLWRLSARLCLWFPAPCAAAVGGIAAALAYGALAGFPLSTRRAGVMVTVALVAMALRRRVGGAAVLGAAAVSVVLLEPGAVVSPGFWLSFAAVAILLAGFGARPRSGRAGRWWRWGRAQWLIGIGMLPLTLSVFGTASATGVIANLVAVPWTGLVVVPLGLAGAALAAASPQAAPPVLQAAAWALDVLWWLLERLAALHPGLPAPLALAPWVAVLGVAGAMLASLPPGTPGRWAGFLALVPALWQAPERPGEGELWLSVLDVGQGLAVVLRTREHAAVYDTGPRYGPGFDAGGAVLVPFLRGRGVRALDRIVLSHPDGDHRGGLRSLRAAFPAARLHGAGGAPCRAGVEWEWNGVRFEVLHPTGAVEPAGNDTSCVLRARAGGVSVLLAGDLERAGEAELVSARGRGLASQVLVVPHHGSATSSGPGFLAAVSPRLALTSTGYANRFGFPAPTVVARLRGAGATVIDTGRAGAVEVALGPGQRVGRPRLARLHGARFWNRRAAEPPDTEARSGGPAGAASDDGTGPDRS